MAKLAYYQNPNELTLSYSILQSLYTCPRQFELSYIIKVHEKDEFEAFNGAGNVDFAFGHCVAAGVQAYFSGKSYEQCLWEMFLAWDIDLDAEKPRAKKSFSMAVLAYEKFIDSMGPEFEDFELAHFVDRKGEIKSAVELTFKLNLDRFNANYSGHIDLVLRHKYENYLVVVELKTTSSVEPAEENYANSSQALGYSMAADSIAKNCTIPGTKYGYDIFYPVYSTASQKWVNFSFHKSVEDRLNFIQDILLAIEEIDRYKELTYFPKRGKSCFDFFRRCQHFDICGLSNENLTRNKTLNQFSQLEENHISFIFTMEEIMEQQRALTNVSYVNTSKFDAGMPL